MRWFIGRNTNSRIALRWFIDIEVNSNFPFLVVHIALQIKPLTEKLFRDHPEDVTPPTLENFEPPHPAPTIAIASKLDSLNNEVSTLRNNSDLESEPFHHKFKRNRKFCLYGEETWAILILRFDNGGEWSGLPKTGWEQTWGGVPWICYGFVDDRFFFVEESGSGATANEIFDLGLQNLSGETFWLPVWDPGSLESWVMGWTEVGKCRCVSNSAGQAMVSGVRRAGLLSY